LFRGFGAPRQRQLLHLLFDGGGGIVVRNGIVDELLVRGLVRMLFYLLVCVSRVSVLEQIPRLVICADGGEVGGHLGLLVVERPTHETFVLRLAGIVVTE